MKQQPQEQSDEQNNSSSNEAQKNFNNFIFMGILFSAVHATSVSCLELAVARLGDLGAWQSGTLYLTYTASSVLGATYVVKRFGSRVALIISMTIYCIYIGCFLVATSFPKIQTISAISGAAIGGIGAGIMWTAQGSYFTEASITYSSAKDEMAGQDASSIFAGIFAFIYLAEEVAMKLLSSSMIHMGYSWENVYALYLLIALICCYGMKYIDEYNDVDTEEMNRDQSHNTILYDINAAWRLLRDDRKMKYMIGLNAEFAITAAFLISYVSSEVEPIALSDNNSLYIGILFSITSLVAAIMSVLFAWMAQSVGKGIVLSIGAASFFMIGFLFMWFPNIETNWGWTLLITVFTLQGLGRATFESTLRATMADMFPHEKEGAFANIILQNGSTSTIIFFLSSSLTPQSYEILIMIMAIIAIFGYWYAFAIFRDEQYTLLS